MNLAGNSTALPRLRSNMESSTMKTVPRSADVSTLTFCTVATLSDVRKRRQAKPRMVEETIDGILAGKGVALVALEQSKPILLVKQKDKDELE
ncbi:hypothetical protein V4S28_07075 [Enterococcus cecorum]